MGDLPFYWNMADTMRELELTRRQLRHWEEEGVFVPEIGYGRYTPRDIERLRKLRVLIVDEKMPLKAVRRLLPTENN